jgi:predicted nicotinamide N-methyase
VSEIDPAEFICTQTTIAAGSLVPEIRLHLATEVTPLWHATEESLERFNMPPPYWAFAWPGGQALARYVLDNPDLVHGRRVLDFAAGCGIAAIAAGRMGASAVEATEIDRFSQAAMALNARLNKIAITILDRDVTGDPAGPWDIVLAGDVFYEKPMADKVEPWLRALAKRGTQVLIADPGRAYLPKEGLREVARYLVPTSLDLEDREIRETRIYALSA